MMMTAEPLFDNWKFFDHSVHIVDIQAAAVATVESSKRRRLKYSPTAATNSDEVIIPSLKMTGASVCIPMEKPGKPRGEDAHFISTKYQTIGVADGVGGWAKLGIDAGKYSRQLMMNSVRSLRRQPRCAGGVNPKRVLQHAYKRTTAKGSSTACIVTLSGDKLSAANVGDSGFLVIRNGDVVYRSPTQQRGFNCPYQLGIGKDNPSICDEIELSVKSGDVVVAGTDGLFDNVCESEVVEIITKTCRDGDLNGQVLYLANAALYNSMDAYTEETPFSIASRKAGRPHKGGKRDDITVIIARIE
ncbi:hypothetical protein ACP275_10G165600 [Erythranthe tilingii]